MDTCSGWLIGSSGVNREETPGIWTRVGKFGFPVRSLQRTGAAVFAGVTGGLWRINRVDSAWCQLHDETLTEVLGLTVCPEGISEAGVLPGFPYGVATSRRDENGVFRWQSLAVGLQVNERFTNAVCLDPADKNRVMAGTEDGILIYDIAGGEIHRTGLNGHPVRALWSDTDGYWAGTDGRGIWKSRDGYAWEPAGRGGTDETVFSINRRDGVFLAGTLNGLLIGDGEGSWRRKGPHVLFAAVAQGKNRWMAGGAPGGLWQSEDRGASWTQTGRFNQVGAILAPETEQE